MGVGREVAYRTESREIVEVEEVEEDIAEVHQSCRTFTRTRGILTENGIALVMKTVLDFPMPPPKGVKGFGGAQEVGDGVVGFLSDFPGSFLGDVAVHPQGQRGTREARNLRGHRR